MLNFLFQPSKTSWENSSSQAQYRADVMRHLHEEQLRADKIMRAAGTHMVKIKADGTTVLPEAEAE